MSVGELSRARFRRMFTGQYTYSISIINNQSIQYTSVRNTMSVGELSRARFRRMFTGQYTYR